MRRSCLGLLISAMALSAAPTFGAAASGPQSGQADPISISVDGFCAEAIGRQFIHKLRNHMRKDKALAVSESVGRYSVTVLCIDDGDESPDSVPMYWMVLLNEQDEELSRHVTSGHLLLERDQIDAFMRSTAGHMKTMIKRYAKVLSHRGSP